MNYADWYTDTVDIWRTTSAKDGSLTVNERTQVAWGVPCRVYLSNDRAVNMTQTAADLQQEDKLACANSVDIRTGDELYIYRGGGLKKGVAASRAFAGEAQST